MSALSLIELACIQAELSERRCSAPCRDYHAAWPVLRAAGLVGGIDADRQPFLDILGPLFRCDAGRRILIAGCADSALLSLVAGVAPATSQITIVDRCGTPLDICRRVAEPNLLLETRQADLLSYQPEAPFDLIVCHSLLPFFCDTERRELLRRLATWLAPQGNMVLAVRLKPSSDVGVREQSQTGQWVAARAAEAGRMLAERLSVEALGVAWRSNQDERLEGYYRFMATQNLSYSCADDAIAEFRRAGLNVTAILPGGEGLSFMTSDWRANRRVPGLVLQATPSASDSGDARRCDPPRSISHDHVH